VSNIILRDQDLETEREKGRRNLVLFLWGLNERVPNLTVRVVWVVTPPHMRHVSLATKQFCSNS